MVLRKTEKKAFISPGFKILACSRNSVFSTHGSINQVPKDAASISTLCCTVLKARTDSGTYHLYYLSLILQSQTVFKSKWELLLTIYFPAVAKWLGDSAPQQFFIG